MLSPQINPPEQQPFALRSFQQLLKTKRFGRSLVFRSETETTMTIAETELAGGCMDGTVVLADFQTGGRGSVPGRSWDSRRNCNLLFSICLRNVPHPLNIPIAASIAIASSLRREGVNAWIKWPNDVWVKDKKVSGLMVTGTTCGQESSHVLGIGINVNEQFEENDRTSLRNCTLRIHSRERILSHLLLVLETLFSLSSEQLLAQYLELQGLVGQTIIVHPKKKESGETYVAKVHGFDLDGLLRIEFDGKKLTLSNEEVTVRPEAIPSKFDEILLLAPIAHDALSGNWENQLGSKVIIKASADGSITGKYCTAVGRAESGQPLCGSWLSCEQGAMVAWVVAWPPLQDGDESCSITGWVGTFDIKTSTITTTWILRSSDEPEWKSTLTNKDVFHKLKE